MMGNDTNVTPESLSRRRLLKAGVAVGGGLLLSLSLPTTSAPVVDEVCKSFQPNAFIEIKPSGEVVLTMHKVEMGQGTYTALPMLIAEELEVSLGAIRLEHARPDDTKFGDPMLGGQATGASNSIRQSWQLLREAGAKARVMLLQAAAERWNVPLQECDAGNGRVVHRQSQREVSYGDIAGDAAMQPLPDHVVLKDPSKFTLIGVATKRLDSTEKVSGKAKYGIDAWLPGMLFATVQACPVREGTLVSVDRRPALAHHGVRQVLTLSGAVAVIAEHSYAAQQGLAALHPQWEFGRNAGLDSSQIDGKIALDATGLAAVARDDGQLAQQAVANRVEAVYHAPYLAHATMEPVNCTVHVRKDGCEIWVGTQVPSRVQAAAAKVLDIPPERVTVHNHLLGGGFGRRLDVDFVIQAVEIAKQCPAPVKVIWTREEDIRRDLFRPRYIDKISAALNVDGVPIQWTHRIAGSSILARWLPNAVKNNVDPDAVNGALSLPYALGAMRVEYCRSEVHGLDTAFWRGVGPTHNAYVVESFIDELAAAVLRDPVSYRVALLDGKARAARVLQVAAGAAGWESRHQHNRSLGVALLNAFGSYIAMVAEVVLVDDEIRVPRVVCAVDCGLIVNPLTLDAQIRGGIIFGLSAALYGKVTFSDGRVVQSNFHDYRVLRINESPTIEVHIVDSAEAPGGVGELGTACIGPAVANAVYVATGKRIRSLPIADHFASQETSSKS
jgi:isoquinoline 1-oxidoreductase beta subunit